MITGKQIYNLLFKGRYGKSWESSLQQALERLRIRVAFFYSREMSLNTCTWCRCEGDSTDPERSPSPRPSAESAFPSNAGGVTSCHLNSGPPSRSPESVRSLWCARALLGSGRLVDARAPKAGSGVRAPRVLGGRAAPGGRRRWRRRSPRALPSPRRRPRPSRRRRRLGRRPRSRPRRSAAGTRRAWGCSPPSSCLCCRRRKTASWISKRWAGAETWRRGDRDAVGVQDAGPHRRVGAWPCPQRAPRSWRFALDSLKVGLMLETDALMDRSVGLYFCLKNFPASSSEWKENEKTSTPRR